MKLILERPQALQMQQTQQQIPLLAQPLPTQRFYARGKTSFSYLAQHLKHKATRADRWPISTLILSKQKMS
jgi:exodeoxyribonuclease V beta subunit